MLATIASIVVLIWATTANAGTCEDHIHTMLAAQGTRAIKEFRFCLERAGMGGECRIEKTAEPDRSGDHHLIALDERLKGRLARVERHAKNKFPRKCGNEAPSFFTGICWEAHDSGFNAKEDLTECLYVDHVLPWADELYRILEKSVLPPACASEIVKQARLGWRDVIRGDRPDIPRRRGKRVVRRCGASAASTWDEVREATMTNAAPLRDFNRRRPQDGHPSSALRVP